MGRRPNKQLHTTFKERREEAGSPIKELKIVPSEKPTKCSDGLSLRGEEKMLRTRLLWFTFGFSVSGAAIAHFVWRDLLTDRYALASDMKQKFDALEARVENLEKISVPNPNLSQAED